MRTIISILCLLLSGQQYSVPNATGALAATSTTNPISGMSFWFSADCITYVSSVCGTPANGTTISSWADRSGNANDLTKFTGTCTFNTNQLNGLPAVTFSTCGLNLTSTITASNGHTVFVVYKNGSSSGNHIVASSLSQGFEYEIASGSGAQNITTAGVAVVGAATNTATVGSWYQVNAFMTNQAGGFSVGFRMNSATDTTSSSSSTNIVVNGPSAIGCYHVGGGATCSGPFSSQIVEIIYYNTTLALGQIQANEAYFRNKYGIA